MLFADHFRREIDTIRSSRDESGWFHSLPSPTLDLYATHYFLKIRSELDLEVYNSRRISHLVRECLVSEFTTERVGFSSTDERLHLRDYYDAASILHLIGDDVSDLRIDRVLATFNNDGQYVLWVDRDNEATGESNLLALYFAAFLRSHTETPEDPELVARLRNAWATAAPDEFNEKALVIASLSLLESDPDELSGVDDWRTNYVEYINELALEGLYGPDLSVLAKLYENTSFDLQADLDVELQPLEDGGYSVAGKDYSDPYGTSSYVTVTGGTSADLHLTPLTDFTEKHQVSTGGYYAVVDREPTIEQTYYGCRALSLFSIAADPGKIPDSVLRRFERSGTLPAIKNLYMLYELVGDSTDSHEEQILEALLQQQTVGDFETIESLYQYVFLCDQTDTSVAEHDICEAANNMYNDCSTRLPSWDEWYFGLKLDTDYGIDVGLNRQGLSAKLDDSWSDSGGFLPLRTEHVSQPTIHSTYYCVRILELLDQQIPDRARILSFVSSHRNDAGCFWPGVSDESTNQITLITTFQSLYLFDVLLQSNGETDEC